MILFDQFYSARCRKESLLLEELAGYDGIQSSGSVLSTLSEELGSLLSSSAAAACSYYRQLSTAPPNNHIQVVPPLSSLICCHSVNPSPLPALPSTSTNPRSFSTGETYGLHRLREARWGGRAERGRGLCYWQRTPLPSKSGTS